MAKSKRGVSRGSKKRALLVGINQYPDARLKGCVNDAIMMGKILIDHFGFQPGADMRLLADGRATKAAILERLAWLLDGARAGDVLVFHYSGHGSQVPCRGDDAEVEGLDECLCPIDMNWDDPLTDDDLASLLKGLPDGANFTAILDCCHSGTGLRMVGPSIPVTDRFLPPPPDIRFRAVEGIEVTPSENYFSVTMKTFRPLQTRRLGNTTQQMGILIAGCRAEQTSKDAFLEGDYHGALTYSLYKALAEEGCEQTYGQWLENSTRRLQGFQIGDQDPQLECAADRCNWKLFSTAAASVRPVAIAPRQTAPRHVVYVHGITHHDAGYSDGWWKAMRRFTPSIGEGNRHEVLWSDIVDQGARALAPQVPGQVDAALAIKDVLQDRLQREQATALPLATPERSLRITGSRAVMGIPGLDGIDDFVKYLLSDSIRDQVIATFTDTVRPLLAQGVQVEIISHSWGTVVAYEALRRMDAEAELPRGVHCLFTVGSALSIAPVKRMLVCAARDGRRPRVVQQWINLDACRDVVGGPLKDNPFEVDFEYLDLLPIGCGAWPTPACAHSSYFHPDNRVVNEEIFGRHIEE